MPTGRIESSVFSASSYIPMFEHLMAISARHFTEPDASPSWSASLIHSPRWYMAESLTNALYNS